jgi:CheY-like chemotaxis protein/two-component sensor histidine kinase
LEAQLRHAQKMDAIGRLASGVAHDFNNVLAAILCHAEYLLESHGHGSSDEDVNGILQAGKRGVALTRQLLMFARNKPMELEVLEVNRLVTDMARLFRRTTEEQVEMKVLLHHVSPHVKADADQLGQVLLNLVVNARDAMPEGGQLELSTSVEDVPPESATAELAAGKYAVLTVKDNGIGMSAEVKARMFEPFFTTKEVGKGTGLGLATVLAIVKQLSGALRVRSELGEGTRIEVLVPVCEAEVQRVQPGVPVQVRSGRNETILLAEDEDVLRALLARMLSDNGYRVLAAADGEQALDLARKHPDAIDLVLTDVVMPRMSGKGLAEEILSTRPSAKVLFMSGHIDQQIVRDGLLDGSVGFLQKPFSPRALLSLMRKVLDPLVAQAGVS